MLPPLIAAALTASVAVASTPEGSSTHSRVRLFAMTAKLGIRRLDSDSQGTLSRSRFQPDAPPMDSAS